MDKEQNPQTFWAKVWFAVKFLEIRLRFVFILVLTGLLIGYWDWIQNYWERWTRGPVAEEQAKSEWEFYCGMHPFVIRDKPGLCPICGMTLDRRKRGEPVKLPPGVLARVQVLPERVMQAGVQTEEVSYRLLSHEVRSYGVVEPAETRTARIVARFPGRVDELLVNATGEDVKQDHPLARIYSPKYLAATLEYLRAYGARRRTEADAQASDEDKRLAAATADGLRQRLLLAGFTQGQLAELEKSGRASDRVTFLSPLSGTVLEKKVLLGDAVEEGMTLYTVADLSTVWVQLQVFESDLAAVRAGTPVEVTSVSWPGELFPGTVDFINPSVTTDNRSVRVRVVVANRERRLLPNMYVNAVIRTPVGRYGVIGSPQEPKVETPAKPAADGYPLDTCVVTGAKLGSMGPPVVYQYQGRTIKFCCGGCIETFKKDPAKYLAMLDKAAPAPAAVQYTCPMHPEVVSDKPGRCPKCNMELVPKAPPKAPESHQDAPAGKAAVQYTCPMHPEVVSDKPGRCPKCNMELVLKSPPKTDEGHQRWAEGYACGMHVDQLLPEGGVCKICGCGMETVKWRVEKVLSIPELAVVDTGARQYVYLQTEVGVYEAVAVKLGRRAGLYFPVLEGVKLGDRVVARGSFLIDAEARLNPATAAGLVGKP